MSKIVYTSKTFDPSTRLPLVVIDSTALPPNNQVNEQLIASVLERLPKSNDFALLFFACGAPNKPSWSWVAKTYAMLERSIKKRVKKIYVVHESWWVRAVTEMLRGIVSSKFKSKIIHVSNLSQLAQLIDITLINITPLVYLHDLKIQDKITIPRHIDPRFGAQTNPNEMPKLWQDCLNYLAITAPNTKGIFDKTDDPQLLYILRDCYDRDQLIDLDDYGPHLAASVLKLYLYELPSPVLPIEYIKLPLNDSKDYCLGIYQTLPAFSKFILSSLMPLLFSVVSNSSRTGKSSSTLAGCVGPSLIGLSSVTKEGIAIGVRYTRNLIEHWNYVKRKAESENLISLSPFSDEGSKKPIITTHYVSPSHISSPLFPSRNASTPELPKFLDDFTNITTMTNDSTTTAMGPPPVPAKLKIMPLKSSASKSSLSDQLPSPVPPPSPPPPIPRRFGPRSKSVASTGRGKMVAELAKLYEEKSYSAQILVDLERGRSASK